MNICKNCKHELVFINEGWYHIEVLRDGDIELSIACPISVDTKESEEFIQEQMEVIDRKIKEKFGKNYGAWYWFAEVHCTCRNPEPEEESK